MVTSRLPRRQNYKKNGAANAILKALEQLHSAFYPRPFKQPKHGDDVPANFSFEPVTDPYATQADLIQLIGQSGNNLHRGSAKRILSVNSPIQVNFPEIITWHNKIEVLLRVHLMPLFESNTLFICILRNIDDAERVQVVLAEPTH